MWPYNSTDNITIIITGPTLFLRISLDARQKATRIQVVSACEKVWIKENIVNEREKGKESKAIKNTSDNIWDCL